MNRAAKQILWVTLFAIAMAYLESAVVVYLRRVYGIGDLILQVPPFDPQIAAIELGRELATLVMLLSVGWIAASHLQSRIGFAVISFGIWDVFYYVWLRVMIGWPQSLLDPDLLFLIPLPWWGPVLSPVLIALLMVAGGVVAVIKDHQGIELHPRGYEWLCLILGVLIMLYAFMADALRAFPADAVTLSLLRPSAFLWQVYLPGLALTVFFVWRLSRQAKSASSGN